MFFFLSFDSLTSPSSILSPYLFDPVCFLCVKCEQCEPMFSSKKNSPLLFLASFILRFLVHFLPTAWRPCSSHTISSWLGLQNCNSSLGICASSGPHTKRPSDRPTNQPTNQPTKQTNHHHTPNNINKPQVTHLARLTLPYRVP